MTIFSAEIKARWLRTANRAASAEDSEEGAWASSQVAEQVWGESR